MYTLGAFLLLAALLGAVTAVVESVLGLLKVDAVIKKIPVVGAHWGLAVAILMVWLLGERGMGYPAGGWGVTMDDTWLNIVANGAMVYAAVPLKDAVISMVNKGLRA